MATYAQSRTALMALLAVDGEYWLSIDGATKYHGPYSADGVADAVISWSKGAAATKVATVATVGNKAAPQGMHENNAPTGHEPGSVGQVFTATASATATGPAAGTGPTIADLP